MKNLKLYFISRRKTIFTLLAVFVINLVVFYLYSVPIAPVIYAAQLIVFMCLILFILDYLKFLRKHYNFKHILDMNQVYQIDLDDTHDQIELDYQEIIHKLIQEKYVINEDKTKSMTELKDYYAIWAHQIKTPIAALDLIIQDEDYPLDKKEIRNQLFKIDFYVDAVMNYLRLEDMSSDFKFEQYQVDSIVKKSVRKFASQFIGKKISITLERLELKVDTDEKWLGFIIEQLLSNALKYTNQNGQVKIYMKETFNVNDRILVIEDNGIGIANEDLPRIFERGYTGYNGRMDKKSSGIGLYLCKKAADKLGCDLSIESEPGKGTRVMINLTQKHTQHE